LLTEQQKCRKRSEFFSSLEIFLFCAFHRCADQSNLLITPREAFTSLTP
jgi:hypothetical protein